MKQLPDILFGRICRLCLVAALVGLVAGCDEAELAIDKILGKRALVLATARHADFSDQMVLAKKRPAGEMPAAPAESVTPPLGPPAQPPVAPPQPPGPKPQAVSPAPAPPAAATPAVEPGKKRVPGQKPPPAPAAPVVAQGKKRAPGQMAPPPPGLPPMVGPEAGPKETFFVTRNPFKEPTEILPSECPPSMPLCRFDYSQLKVVGVIQVSEGHYKGMVEDPDGRGYFVATGTQIGNATVTQVNNRGIRLHSHKTRTDVVMPLSGGGKEVGEF